ncbi:MAG: diguanylate cyclase (GGDEF)-like protein [Colwellia sp.]|jgi:diguanylate cyclase (GGDEF)-like protein
MHLQQKKFIQKIRIFYILVASSIFLGGFIYVVLSQSAKQVIESHALLVASIVAEHATTSRSIYAKNIAGKLKEDGFGPHVNPKIYKGFVPIPAQFLRLVGEAATKKSHNLFRYKPVSKWNIQPKQGIDDDFLIWAWSQLEMQDQVNPTKAIGWKPIYRFEHEGNTPVLRYLYPDPASEKSCATCHSTYEKTPEIIHRRKQQGTETGKQWKQHQLLGALSITVPLNIVEQDANNQIKRNTTLLTLTTTLSILLIAWFTRRTVRQESKILDLDWESTHDPLTKLLNRRGMENMFADIFAEIGQKGSYLFCAIDLDKFKSINDTYGHKAGDLILQGVSNALIEVTRDCDFVVRLGGDEFFIILVNTTISHAKNEGQRLLSTIRSVEVEAGNEMLSVSASIGITEYDTSDRDFSKGMERADKASYEAKVKGRDQVFIIGTE